MSGRIAKCTWPGETFRAEHIADISPTLMKMRAIDKCNRFTPGTVIIVAASEVREWLRPSAEGEG